MGQICELPEYERINLSVCLQFRTSNDAKGAKFKARSLQEVDVVSKLPLKSIFQLNPCPSR